MPGYRARAIGSLSAADLRSLVCPYCRLLLRNAVQTREDGIRLCESCYNDISLKLSEGCSAPVVPGCKIFTDRAARREISEVEVLCDYCEWTGKEKYLQVHLRSECLNAPVHCPHEGCKEMPARCQLDDHVQQYCHHRRVLCDWCLTDTTPHLLENHIYHCRKFARRCGHVSSNASRRHLAQCESSTHEPSLFQLDMELQSSVQERGIGQPAVQVVGHRPLQSRNTDSLRWRLSNLGLQEDPRHLARKQGDQALYSLLFNRGRVRVCLNRERIRVSLLITDSDQQTATVSMTHLIDQNY